MERPGDSEFTGIEALLRARRDERPDRFVQIDQAGITKWSREGPITYWRAVALHSFLDPDAFGADRDDQWRYLQEEQSRLQAKAESSPERLTGLDKAKLQLFENLRITAEALETSLFSDVYGTGKNAAIWIDRFHTWAITAGLKVVSGWPARPEVHSNRWPWGRHTTPRLEALAAAAAAHWRHVDEGGGYVPGDKTTASTNPKVAAWIHERYPDIGYETALIMARLLRDPALEKGRPPGS